LGPLAPSPAPFFGARRRTFCEFTFYSSEDRSRQWIPRTTNRAPIGGTPSLPFHRWKSVCAHQRHSNVRSGFVCVHIEDRVTSEAWFYLFETGAGAWPGRLCGWTVRPWLEILRVWCAHPTTFRLDCIPLELSKLEGLVSLRYGGSVELLLSFYFTFHRGH
jgi:hypothetical protein